MRDYQPHTVRQTAEYSAPTFKENSAPFDKMFGEIHWSERQLDPVQVSHGSGETSRRQERHARIRLLRKVLAQYGLEVGDDWGATSYMVGNRKGDQRLAATMGGLWQVAEQMAGKPLDPLDESLLKRLRNVEDHA